MLRHTEEKPLAFYLSELEPELLKEITEWFIRRQPLHVVRKLVNRERDDYGSEYELIFDNKKDAMEFKLTFL